MSAVEWHAKFPDPKISKYGLRPGESIARTQMESGAARQRQRFTTTPSYVTIEWVMAKSIFGMFESWYIYKAKAGGEWVSMYLNNGLGRTLCEVRFLQPYEAKPLSHKDWAVMASVEVREMPVLGEGALDIMLDGDITPTELTKVASDLRKLVQTTIPGYNW